MNLRELYETSIRLGMALDVRGEAALRAQMERVRREYEALPEAQRPAFDRERFRNPFGDVRIAVGPEDVELRTILLGINIGVPELLLADRLRSRGQRIDAVIAHHTSGIGIAPSLVHDFMPVAIEFLTGEGVPRDAAERVIGAYVEEKWRDLEDFHRSGPDTARLLGFPLACIHTPADYYIGEGVRPAVEAAAPRTVGDVQRAIDALPEVQGAARAAGASTRVMSGTADWPAGRMLLKFGGGYILPPEAYTLLGEAGVNTVVQIGCTPVHARAAEAAGVAIVRVPHAACDNIGINLLLDAVEQIHGPLEVIACNSFERIRRC
ncbi:MAG TPA: hypothetical protein VNK05_17885 [Chloroflexota bacterium]|nr:hypothetical protein [Chloroflexota bacterium]